jgi:hypothetical protein
MGKYLDKILLFLYNKEQKYVKGEFYEITDKKGNAFCVLLAAVRFYACLLPSFDGGGFSI